MKLVYTFLFSFLIAFPSYAQDPNALLRVVVRDENSRGISGAQVSISSSSVRRTMGATDGNGYTEENPPKNVYQVEARADGYLTQSQEVDLQSMTTIGFNLIKVRDEGRDQSANDNALLRVFVKDRNSNAIAGARGQLRRIHTGEDRPMGVTDGNGYFENNPLKNDYELVISRTGYITETREIILNRMMTVTIYLQPDGDTSSGRGPTSVSSGVRPAIVLAPPRPPANNGGLGSRGSQ